MNIPDDNTPDNRPPRPKPFPTASVFFGIAVALIALWLLAGGLSQLLGTSNLPSNSIEAGPTK